MPPPTSTPPTVRRAAARTLRTGRWVRLTRLGPLVCARVGADDKRTCLHLAASEGNGPIVEYLLASGAVIQGSINLTEWPLMPPMKSYGQGRDHPGPRHVSLLHGFHLSGLTIGGENGTVNGGGPFWWARHREKRETHTRGHLFECLNCSDLLFQDVT